MPSYTLTISDAAVPVLQKSFDAENARLKSVGQSEHKDLNVFLSWVVANYYGVTDAQVEATLKEQALAELVAKAKELPVSSIATVTATADSEASKIPKAGMGK